MNLVLCHWIVGQQRDSSLPSVAQNDIFSALLADRLQLGQHLLQVGGQRGLANHPLAITGTAKAEPVSV